MSQPIFSATDKAVAQSSSSPAAIPSPPPLQHSDRIHVLPAKLNDYVFNHITLPPTDSLLSCPGKRYPLSGYMSYANYLQSMLVSLPILLHMWNLTFMQMLVRILNGNRPRLMNFKLWKLIIPGPSRLYLQGKFLLGANGSTKSNITPMVTLSVTRLV